MTCDDAASSDISSTADDAELSDQHGVGISNDKSLTYNVQTILTVLPYNYSGQSRRQSSPICSGCPTLIQFAFQVSA